MDYINISYHHSLVRVRSGELNVFKSEAERELRLGFYFNRDGKKNLLKEERAKKVLTGWDLREKRGKDK